MPIKLITSKGIKVKTEKQPFAKGGEGAVHKIISPANYTGLCAKLYFPKQRSKRKKDKIEYMVHNPPPNLTSKNHIICWAKEALFQGKEFVGFIMPLAFDGSIQLYELCTPKLKAKLGKKWINKFDRNSNKGIQSRLKLCTNLAAAIHNIHSLQKYVLVDLKPQNVLVTDDGKVSVIDCDSIQISNNGQILFPARVATAEYVPPEGANINPSKDVVLPSWDRFSMAIMFYEVLFGLHPYAASFSGRYQNSDTLDSKIKSGLFVHGKNKTFVSVLPPLHKNFGIIPHALKQLFTRAFDSGNQMPDVRPTAEEWGKTIFTELKRGTVKQQPMVSMPVKRQPSQPITNGIKHKSTSPNKKTNNDGWIIFFTLLIIAISTGLYFYLNSPPEYKPTPQEQTTIPAKINFKETIRAFIRAEDSKKIDEIMPFYDNNVIRYWDMKYPSKNDIRKRYLATWNKVVFSSNEIESIIEQSANEFLLKTKFTFKSKKTQNTEIIISSVHIKLRNNKIVEIYEKSRRPLTVKPSIQPPSNSQFVEINRYFKMVDNAHLRRKPEQNNHNIKKRGIDIYNYVNGLGYSIKNIRVFVYKRERIRNTVIKGCDGRGEPYWYYVKIIFPNNVSDTGWMWGGCLIPAN